MKQFIRLIIRPLSSITFAAVLIGTGNALISSSQTLKGDNLTAHAAYFCGEGNHKYKYSYSNSYERGGWIFCYDVYTCSKCHTTNQYLREVHHR